MLTDGLGQPEAARAQSCKAEGVQAKVPQEGWQPAEAQPHCLSLGACGTADDDEEDSPKGRNVVRMSILGVRTLGPSFAAFIFIQSSFKPSNLFTLSFRASQGRAWKGFRRFFFIWFHGFCEFHSISSLAAGGHFPPTLQHLGCSQVEISSQKCLCSSLRNFSS